MSNRDVGVGEMHGFNDEDVDAVLEGRTAAVPSEVAAFVGELRHAYAAEGIPQPPEALTELFARGLPMNEPARVAATSRRNRVFKPFNRLGTAAKAALVGVLLVGASTGLAAADLLPQSVDDKVSSVVPFVAKDSVDDDGTPDQGSGDAPGTPGAEDPGEAGRESGPSNNSGPGSANSGSSGDDDGDDDDTPTSTPTTIDDSDDRDDTTATTIDDDDDTTATTIDDDDDTTATTIDDDDDDDNSGSGSGSDDEFDDDSDKSGSGGDDSGSGSDDD